MNDFITWLNANAGALNLVFAAVVAIATVFYAILTKALVSETRRMREAQTEPQVTVRAESSPIWINLVDLIIENIGGGPAFDLRLTAEPDFEATPGRPLSQFGPFKHGVRVFGPHQRIDSPLANLVGKGAEIEDPNGPLQFVVRIRYRGALGRIYSHSYPIDFRHLVGSRRIGTPPLQAIAKSLEQIQKDVSHLTTGWARLKVVSYIPEDVRREDDEEFGEAQSGLSSKDESSQEPT